MHLWNLKIFLWYRYYDFKLALVRKVRKLNHPIVSRPNTVVLTLVHTNLRLIYPGLSEVNQEIETVAYPPQFLHGNIFSNKCTLNAIRTEYTISSGRSCLSVLYNLPHLISRMNRNVPMSVQIRESWREKLYLWEIVVHDYSGSKYSPRDFLFTCAL